MSNKQTGENSAELELWRWDMPIERLEEFPSKCRAMGATKCSYSVQWGYYNEVDGVTLIAEKDK